MIQKPNYNLANIQSDWLQNKGKVTLGLDNYNSKNFSRKNIYLIIFNNNFITYNAQNLDIYIYTYGQMPLDHLTSLVRLYPRSMPGF